MSLFTSSCVGFAVSSMFYVMIVDAGSQLPTLIAIQGLGFWICSNHVESILDPSCHTWTLKYAYRWKVLFIFLFTQTHTENGVQSSHHQTFVLLENPSWISSSNNRNHHFQDFLIWWLVFPQHSGLSLLLTTCPALPFYSLPSWKSPIWAIRTAIYAGFLLLRAQQAVQSFHRTHSCGCFSGGGNPQPSMTACKGCQREHQGWHFIFKEACMCVVSGGEAWRETGMLRFSESKEETRCSIIVASRVKTCVRGQTLLGRGQSSASHLERWKCKGCSLNLCQVPDNGVVLFLTLHCNQSENRILELQFR